LIVYSFAKDKKIIKKTSMIWFMMIGLLGLKLLFLTPWFGGIIKLLTIFWGFGGVMFLFKSKFLNDSKS
jgi:signal transduction histidine kinase